MSKKHNLSAAETNTGEDLQVVVIKKSHGVCSQQIRMKLPPQTTFGSIVNFMYEQGLLETKKAVVRPAHKESHIIGHNRKIQQCVNIIKLRFIVEEVEESKAHPGQKVQALRNNEGIQADSHQKTSVCGRDDCNIM